MGNCHPRKPMSTEAKPCQKYRELICNTSRRTVIIFRVSTWYSWCVMQPASPGILGICVRTSATVPSISVTESMAVEEMHQVEVFVKI